MMLIISDKNDKYADRVESILLENAAEYSRLNLDNDSLKATQIKSEDNSFRVEGPNCSFLTSEIEAVWNRSTRINQFIENCSVQDEGNLICNDLWNKTLGKLFALLKSTKWLNFYHDFYAETQLGHYVISKNIGLKWPSYICSNDINYLNSFFESKKERVLELMNQDCMIRSTCDFIEKSGDKFGTANMNEMQQIKCLIPDASYLVRCTVVGNEYFASKIKANDSHEKQQTNTILTNNMVVKPPKSIKMKVFQIMTELNLTHGVFDFIVTKNDEWVFDSLNPARQYQWIEDIHSSDISSSIAKWLMINN